MADQKKRVAVLVSGGGTNLQALIDAANRGETPHADIVLVVASRPGVFALERAEQAGIATAVVSKKDYEAADAYDKALGEVLAANRIDIVVLAGFLSIVGPRVLAAYPGRIINVHPSLIPQYCGGGMYGLKVHEAVLAAGETVTGATVHRVNEITDGGQILMQKQVAVQPGDTPETLQHRVMEQAEWVLLPQVLERLCRGDYEEE